LYSAVFSIPAGKNNITVSKQRPSLEEKEGIMEGNSEGISEMSVSNLPIKSILSAKTAPNG